MIAQITKQAISSASFLTSFTISSLLPLPLGSFYFVINQAIIQAIPPNTNRAGKTPPSNSMLVLSLPSRLVNVCSKSPSISFFQFMQPLLSFLRRYSQCAKLNLPLNGVGVFHPLSDYLVIRYLILSLNQRILISTSSSLCLGFLFSLDFISCTSFRFT